ncbi:surface-adhesin E family protein [Citrobacter tructae]|uniref:surface-adhesin E family protein n=1 Tax=Citrobacter tructae TaxID=2562449 RepID=UPI003F55D3F4
MKRLLLCVTLALLAGCTSQTQSQAPQLTPRPAGLVKLLEDDTGGTYADMRTVSSYQGNTQLRRFYLINNYVGPRQMQTTPPVYVASSSVINVVNCETKQRAQFERIYYSQYWAQGDVIAKRAAIGQWEPYPEESLIGIIATSVCQIKAATLKPEPPRDTHTPLLGEFN